MSAVRYSLVGWLTVPFCVLSVQAQVPGAPEQAPTAFNYADIDQAWNAARQSDQPLLVFVSMENCHYCKKMVRDTWSHPQIASSVRNTMAATTLMKADRPELVKKLGVRAFPTTLVISPGGELLARVEGYANPVRFVDAVRPALAAHAQAQRTAAADVAGGAGVPWDRQ